jgi:hypothetical protein
MLKKSLSILGVLAMVGAILGGCNRSATIQFQGELRTEEEVEEMLADLIESENPDLDIEVDIYEDVDD